MKTGFRVGCVISVFLCLMSIPVIFGIREHDEKKNNPCVAIQPQDKAISGKIVLSAGGFGAGRIMYILYYPGTHRRSGIECEHTAYVTDIFKISQTILEYNRQMYGDK